MKGHSHTDKTRRKLSRKIKARWKEGVYEGSHFKGWQGKKGEERKARQSRRMKRMRAEARRGKRPHLQTGITAPFKKGEKQQTTK